MENETPDILNIELKCLTNKPFPVQPDFRIAISDDAYQLIRDHAIKNKEVEICGVLIGDTYKDPDGPYLYISAAIRGEYADNQSGQVMFTHDTWTHIHSVKDELFSDQLVVGWYHTHPKFGIFLSEQEVFIQRNFFSQPWQVA